VKYYVYKVSKYTCLAYVRKKYSTPEFSFGPDLVGLLKDRDDESAQEKIQKLAIQMLHRECRQIFRLFFLDGYSYREIGEKLKINEGTVKSRMFRCKEKARQINNRLLKKKELL